MCVVSRFGVGPLEKVIIFKFCEMALVLSVLSFANAWATHDIASGQLVPKCCKGSRGLYSTGASNLDGQWLAQWGRNLEITWKSRLLTVHTSSLFHLAGTTPHFRCYDHVSLSIATTMYDPVFVGDRPIFPCNPSKHPTKNWYWT